jgi:transposase
LTLPLKLRELSVVEERYRAVLEVAAGVPVTEVANRYGVSRQNTAYRTACRIPENFMYVFEQPHLRQATR